MLHPSELRCTLLIYAAPYTEPRLTLNELRGNLKSIMSSAPHLAHRSFAVPFGESNIYHIYI
jgi:hypothetical protein